MSVETEASELLAELAGPSANVKDAIRRAAMRAGLTFGRARKLWYREARVWAEEMDQLRYRAAKARETKQNDLRGSYAELGKELEQLRSSLDQLREKLARAGIDCQG